MGQEQHAVVGGRVLVVCAKNVSCSPYIERRLARIVGAHGIAVTSRGTRALVGEPMDRAVAAELRERGCETEGFVARQLTQGDLDEADLIVTAGREQRAEVVRMSPRAMARCFALLDLADIAAAVDPSSYGAAAPSDSWVQHVTARLAARRGLVPPRDPETAEIVDPTGQGSRAHARMVRDVEGALPALVAGIAPATAVTTRRR